MSIILLKPIPRVALWGGSTMKDYFGYDTYANNIGQSWCFSVQGEVSNEMLTGAWKGKDLRYLWNNQPHLFQSKYKEFPYIIAFVCPEDDLSIQVHPDEAYATTHGLTSGKNEAWYFLDAKENATLVYGHHANNKQELKACMEEEGWDALVQRLPIAAGDFVYVPAGTLHAMQKGVVAYEVQQACDVTYRLFDYHRKDELLKERALHLREGLECVKYETHPVKQCFTMNHHLNIEETIYHQGINFTIRKLNITNKAILQVDEYLLISVTMGHGVVEGTTVKLGDSFLVPATLKNITISGQMELMVTSEGKNNKGIDHK